MGGLTKKPKVPKPPKPIPMPDEDEARRAAARRLTELRARSGVESTLLTDGGGGGKETLG
jgi:hypothetical protein